MSTNPNYETEMQQRRVCVRELIVSMRKNLERIGVYERLK